MVMTCFSLERERERERDEELALFFFFCFFLRYWYTRDDSQKYLLAYSHRFPSFAISLQRPYEFSAMFEQFRQTQVLLVVGGAQMMMQGDS